MIVTVPANAYYKASVTIDSVEYNILVQYNSDLLLSPLVYIVRTYNNVAKALVQALYGYYQAAVAYTA